MATPVHIPPVLAKLLPPAAETGDPLGEAEKAARDVIFLIKSSPIDDEFVLWLAPKLEADGYRVFADILTLQPGDRWRREINLALQYRAVKVLVVSRDATLSDPNVQDDIDIALEVSKELRDARFIIPLRLEPGRKVKGIGDAVTVDFVRGWGEVVPIPRTDWRRCQACFFTTLSRQSDAVEAPVDFLRRLPAQGRVRP